MKRVWDIHELIEQWTLLPRELELLHNKTGSTRLGYAVCLKFFQHEARFPNSPQEVPKVVLRYVAQQAGVEPEQFRDYDLRSRTGKYHRQQIRAFYGFRRPTTADARELSEWLLQNVLPQTLDIKFLENAATQRLREVGIEPMSLRRLHRLIHSAIRTYEQQLCKRISERLSPESQHALDQLLNTFQESVNAEGITVTQSKASVFTFLNSDPSAANLNNLLQEVEKLKLLRQLGLPLDLFQDVALRLLPLTELVLRLNGFKSYANIHPLSATAWWQRSQEITDNLVDFLIQIIHKLGTKAERRVTEELIQDFKRVTGKQQLLYRIASAALANPDGTVRDVIYPIATPGTLSHLIQEFQSTGTSYRQKVHKVIRRSYQQLASPMPMQTYN